MLQSGHRALIALLLLGFPALFFACSRSGKDERRADPGSGSAVPTRTGPVASPFCVQRRRCCDALDSMPELKTAQSLCRMHSREDAMMDQLAPGGANRNDICRMELVQLENIWKMHALSDAGATTVLPPECDGSR